MTEIEALRAKVAAYDAAADKFLTKVRDGRAKSQETARELLAAYLLPSSGTDPNPSIAPDCECRDPHSQRAIVQQVLQVRFCPHCGRQLIRHPLQPTGAASRDTLVSERLNLRRAE